MASQIFTLSDELKDAIGTYASAQNKAIAAVIREAVAAHIGYDLSQETRTRRGKYANKEERKKARAQIAKDKRAKERQILDKIRRQQHEDDVAYVERSLNK